MKNAYVYAGIGAVMTMIAASSAQADDPRWPKWYLGLTGGYTYMQDQDISGQTTATRLDPGGGYGVGGSIGYTPGSSDPFLNALRVEFEVTYHHNSVNKVQLAGGGSVSGPSEYSSTAYMANLFYDFGAGSQWNPYIGGGAGIANLHVGSNPSFNVSSTSDNVFAYQGMAGIGYSPVSIPNTEWTIGYRYLGTADPKFSTPTGSAKTSYDTHSVEAGVKFKF